MEKLMMSWIIYVVRSATCGRAVKTLPFLTSSPSWFSCFSKEPQTLEEEGEERELAHEDALGSLVDLLVLVQMSVGQLVWGFKGSSVGWLYSLTERMTLSMGYKHTHTINTPTPT